MSAVESPTGFLLHALAAGMTQEEMGLAIQLVVETPSWWTYALYWSPESVLVDADYLMYRANRVAVARHASHVARIDWRDVMGMRWRARPTKLWDPTTGWITEPFMAERL